MNDKPDYSNLLAYLKREHENNGGRSNLCIVAARAKVSEGELHDIIDGKLEIDEEMAMALSLITQPDDDQWSLDPDDPQFNDHPNLSNEEIVTRLRFARSEGVLGVIAQVSGVKGGVAALDHICDHGGKLDAVTKMLLLNVMTEEDDNEQT